MNLDYIAGFFDGEGSFTIGISYRPSETKYGYFFKPVIDIAQKDIDILRKIEAFLGFGCLHTSLGTPHFVITKQEDCRRFIKL